MRNSVALAIVLLTSALTMGPRFALAQSDRDFVFTDEDGHLVVRFVGTGATGLDPSQAEEILNAEFSSMVHDRLRADLMFEDEPRDRDWDARMAPVLREHASLAGLHFTEVFVECRAASCRIVMDQPGHWSVSQHLVVLEAVVESLEDFIAEQRPQFEPGFMITAYYQQYQIPHIKAFLRRAALSSQPH
jgi:hypothetical protein